MKEYLKEKIIAPETSKIASAELSQLIQRALKDDRPALAEIVSRHLKLVYNIGYYYAGNSDDAQDIAQETFVKVWKNLRRYDPNKNFKNWIFEIAKNTSLDWLKKKKAIPFSRFETESGGNSLLATLADHAARPDFLWGQKDRKNNLSRAISRLAPSYQKVVSLHGEEGYTFKEIARADCQPINTVKSRYRRALAMLKKHLSQ
jgi:RNA polymerase sigma-70 factor (ECF subfamily)